MRKAKETRKEITKETKKEKRKEKKERRSLFARISARIILSLLLGAVLTFLTLFIPVRISSVSDIEDMNFGKPFAFVHQSSGAVIREEFLPVYAFIQINLLEDATELNIETAFASLGANCAAVLAVVFVIFIIKEQRKKKEAGKNSRAETETPVFEEKQEISEEKSPQTSGEQDRNDNK